MNTIFCIDDTDNLGSARGTGELASLLIAEIEDRGWGKGNFIVRHQLYVHPDIPYTSHNSAMSFNIEVSHTEQLDQIVSFAKTFLTLNSQEGSDPGLCMAIISRLKNPELLINFGQAAKQKVLSKDKAYQLAAQLGIHLSEHGGTGDGVIGALAGVGLRLSGNDGRIRGKHLVDQANKNINVKDIYSMAKIDLVKSIDGIVLRSSDMVQIDLKVKSIYQEGKSVLLVCPNNEISEAKWRTCPVEYIKSISN